MKNSWVGEKGVWPVHQGELVILGRERKSEAGVANLLHTRKPASLC